MEERTLNEKESLELIARMIQNSKRNLEIGDRNIFLLWGWLGVLVPLVVLGAVWKTGNPAWNWLWFLIPLVGWPVQYWLTRKESKPVITYTDRVLNAVWRTVGIVGMSGIIWLCLIANNMTLMLPGVILVVAIGSAITGSLIEDCFLAGGAYFSLALAVVAWAVCLSAGLSWHLYYFVFSASFFIMLVIPGWAMNRKKKRS